MARTDRYVNPDTGKVIEKKVYTMQEQAAYHTQRARRGSINPKTNKPYSDAARARSQGWLSHAKATTAVFNLKNPNYKAEKEAKKNVK